MENAVTEDLPSWNLDDFYSGPEAPEIDTDLANASDAALAFEKSFLGRVNTLSSTEFASAIKRYEDLVQDMHRVGSYAQLLYAADVSNPDVAKFYQSVHEQITDISTHTLFFTLEINRLDDAAYETLIAKNLLLDTDPGYEMYAHFATMSCRMTWSSFCIKSQSPGVLRGRVCLMKPWLICGSMWTVIS